MAAASVMRIKKRIQRQLDSAGPPIRRLASMLGTCEGISRGRKAWTRAICVYAAEDERKKC